MVENQKLVKVSDIVESQIPDFILEDNPNFVDFLKQYYISQEHQGGVLDLAENLDTYKNFSSFDSDNLVSGTTLTSDIEFFDDTISVESTKGWPNTYGLLKINNEIITYTGKTTTTFTGCIRGFSGIDSLKKENDEEFLNFSSTEADEHSEGDSVKNLSNLFLLQFFQNQKSLYTPGFEKLDFYSDINPQNFISKAKTFYQSKGTDEAYKILFRVLYGEEVKIVKPREFCFTSSDDGWVVTETFICDLIDGDPYKVTGQTLYQDADPNNSKVLDANGSIYAVDSYQLDGKVLYKIRIFAGYSNNLNPKGSIFGTFVPTFKTYVVEDVTAGSNTVFVDSTIGFPNSGSFSIGDVTYNYTDKTNNQFLNVSTSGSSNIIDSIERKSQIFSTNYVYSYEDGDESKVVRMRVNNVLATFEPSSAKYASVDDPLRVDNIGDTSNNVFVQSLKFNHPLTIYSGKAVEEIDAGVRSFSQEGFAITNGLSLSKFEHNLKPNDLVDLYVRQQGSYQLYLGNLQVSTALSKEFSVQQIEDTSILDKEVIFRRQLKKTKATPFSKLYNEINEKYTANIQDAFTDENYNYITSNGLPDYEVNPYIKEFTLNANTNNTATLVGSHNFYTGESVKVVGYGITGDMTAEFLDSVGFATGNTYYVKKFGPALISLSETRESLDTVQVNLLEINPENGFISGYFTDIVLQSSKIYGTQFSTSKILKSIPKVPKFERTKAKTEPGPIGVFCNGVEIQNYKSFDKIYYGQIETVDILNGGDGYSLVTPPEFRIFNLEEEDTQTFIIPEMEGSLRSLKVVNAGYNYEETPTVTITGGNKNDVTTSVKMRFIDKELKFNATTRSTVVRTVDNTFQFGRVHPFTEGEAVVYETNGTFPIGIGTDVESGTLLDQSVYYISEVGAATSFRLAPSFQDALNKTNLIDLRTTGGGVQNFRSLEKIQVIDEVTFVGIQSGFKFKKISFAPEDINTFDNIFTSINHGYSSGEEVVVTAEGSPLGGVVADQIYYVDRLDSDRFRLTTDRARRNILDISALDFATTYFVQYPDIKVEVSGKFKKTSSAVTGYGATVVADVVGKVTSARVQRGLAKPAKQLLGNREVVNLHQRPRLEVREGYDAEFLPLIEDGKVIDVIVKNSGEDYVNDFDIIVEGQGYGCQLSPVVSNGEIVNGEVSYNQIIDVVVVNTGVGYAATDTRVYVQKKGKDLSATADLTTWTLNEVSKLGSSNLQNGFLFGAKYSRFGNTYGTFFLDSNLRQAFNIDSSRHSPIVGWAYDGSPIYGPYAYENVDGTGNIIKMRSGYTRNKISPPALLECIEDYEFTSNGTLDSNNGRFAITPEYPEGVYAYYCTLDTNDNPEFPYIIGNQYNYLPEQANFDLDVNQNLNFNDLGVTKYTKPYRVDDKTKYYEYFDNVLSVLKPDAVITSVSRGSIDRVEVIDGGVDYEVGDTVQFEEEESNLFAFGEVSKISGVEVNSLTSGISTVNNIVLLTTENGIVGIATTAHGFLDKTFVSITGVSSEKFSELEGFRKVNVEESTTYLAESLLNAATTGIVTSIKVKSPLETFAVDDRIVIGTETLTIFGIDELNNRLVVRRADAAAPGYAVSETVTKEKSRFSFNYEDLDSNIDVLDYAYYFNPSESVSVGVSTVIGVGNTLTVYPLGYGVSITKFVENGGIFVPFNRFVDGERVEYTTDASSIVSNAGNLTDIIDLYVVKLAPDIIGLVQNYKDVKNRDSLLRFNSVGTGNYHRFKTSRSGVVTCTASQINVNVATASSHGLSINNIVDVNVKSGITTTVVVGYSSTEKRVLIDGEVNPNIVIYANETLIFDLTDASIDGKDFNLYSDNFFRNTYFSSEDGIEVVKTSTDLTLSVGDNTPRVLFYNLTNVTTNDEIFEDSTVANNNQIKVEQSVYNQVDSSVVGVSTNSFTYNLQANPEKLSYSSSNSTISYNVTNSGVKGPISKVNLRYGGTSYRKLPSVSNIVSENGVGANLNPITSTIGNVRNVRLTNTESLYSSDKTLAPVTSLFSAVKVKDNYEVSELRLVDTGRKYINPPRLILYNEVDDVVDSEFSANVELKSQSVDSVSVVNGSKGLKTTDNRIVPINNSNGLKVLSVSVSGAGPYDVDLTLETPLTGFSTANPMPIGVGDTIFVENIISSGGGNGFNSSDRKYRTFNVTFANPNFSAPDAAVVRYQLDTDPGVFDSSTFNASVTRYEDMVKVEAVLNKRPFFNAEKISGNDTIDNDINEPLTDVVKFYSKPDFSVGDIIEGDVSKTTSEVSSIETFSAKTEVNSSVTEIIGWKDFRGNLSTILQKLQDNDYYQDFSYSLKSRKSFTDWQPIVSDLAHVTGYKQFGDLSVESELPVGYGKTLTVTSESASQINVALVSEADISRVDNFDLVIEEDIDESEGLYSEYLKFGSKKLSDYLESSQNRVLSIDDISSLFDTDNSPFVLIPVDTVDTTDNLVLKYFFFIGSTVSFFGDFEKPETFDLFVTRNDDTINLTSYAYYYDFYSATGVVQLPLGEIEGTFNPSNTDEIIINFTPRNIFNSYAISAIKDTAPVAVGIASTSYGYVDSIEKTVGISTTDTEVLYSYPLADITSGTGVIGISTGERKIEDALEFTFIKKEDNTIGYNLFAEQRTKNLGTFGISTTSSAIEFTYTAANASSGLGITVFTNLQLTNTNNVSPNTVTNPLSVLVSEATTYTGSSQFTASSVSEAFAATKFVVEAEKDDGVSLQRSIFEVNSVHFQDYNANTLYGFAGDLDFNEFDVDTIYNSGTGEYLLSFTPSSSATYNLKVTKKSIISPNV